MNVREAVFILTFLGVPYVRTGVRTTVDREQKRQKGKKEILRVREL